MNSQDSRGNSRWDDDVFVERVLAESSQRAPTLSEARKAEVLKALLDENARLAAATRSRPQQQRIRWRDAFTRILNPRVASGLAVAAALALVITGYVLYGGSRLEAVGTVSGTVVINEVRRGPFGLEWQLSRSVESAQSLQLHKGDEIVAVTPITITYPDGSQTVAMPGARLSFLRSGDGVALIKGEIANQILKSPIGVTKFTVESATGTMAVKGTEFRVLAESDTVVNEFTDAGLVGVTNDVGATDVATGEQVRLTSGARPVAELQVPRVNFETTVAGRVVTTQTHVPFTARIFPAAVLIVLEEPSGKEFARYVPDPQGLVLGELVLPGEGSTTLRFRQQAADGRESALSEPVVIEVDQTPPSLGVSSVERERDGESIVIRGRVEPGSALTVNGSPAPVNADGTFEYRVNLAANLKSVEIVATDAAGNSTSIVQTLDQ